MSKYHLYIELNTRRIFLKNNGSVVYQFPVAIGKPSTPTPTGNFSILNKIMNPGGVLGTRWMQFTRQNHGIHGTNQPWLIGEAVSLGCVRMHNYNVETLYPKVSVGTPLTIKHKLNFTSNNNPNNNDHNNSNPNNSNPDNNQPSTGKTYTVKKGDSLWKIAQKFGTTVYKLKRANKLSDDIIYPGQEIIIPNR